MSAFDGKSIKDAVMKAPQFKRPPNTTDEEWVVSIMENTHYDLETMKAIITDHVKGKPQLCGEM
jgi:hypothetical protein